MLFFWTFELRILKKVSVSTKIFNSISVKKLEIKHIRMISEGSCGTEDWSNDAEN